MPAHSKAAKPSTQIAVIGIDIGKNIFHLIGLDRCGVIILKAKLSRGQLENRLANLPPCLIGMEACVGSHHLSRRLMALGHDARLMPAQYVKPFLKGHKNDYRDAEALCGSRAAANHAVRGRQNGRTARSASAASRAGPPGEGTYRNR